MKRGAITKLMMAGCLLAAVSAMAVTEGSNPYERIVDRNVFGLKPMPKPEDNLPPPTPAPNIELQGITSILGRRQVMFKIKASKPGEKEQSYMLSEGQRQDEVEVLAIDLTLGTVQFNNHGTIQTLNMKDDASRPPTTAVPVPIARSGPPTRPGMPTAPAIPRPGQAPLRQFPSRIPRTARSTTTAPAGATAPPPTASHPRVAQLPQSNLSHEEQEVLIEAQRMKAQEEGDPTAKIFPNTSLTPILNQEASGNTEQAPAQ